MPPAALIGIAEFVEETRDDYNSPTTSTFASRMPDCRQTIAVLEEVMCIKYLMDVNNFINILIFYMYVNVQFML